MCSNCDQFGICQNRCQIEPQDIASSPVDDLYDINGFVFNALGDLVKEPENASLELLKDTIQQLYKAREYIKASRIQHRINVIEMA